MTLNFKNQNDILNLEKLNSNEIEYIFSDKPINRLKTKPQIEEKIKLLDKLRSENINDLKILLANKATAMLHGEDAAQNSEQAAKEAFSGNSLGSNLPSVKIETKQLENNINRLEEDHKKAKEIEETLKSLYFVKKVEEVKTEEISQQPIILSPAVRKIVTEKNINLDNVKGTGKAGRILKGDLISMMGSNPQPNQRRIKYGEEERIKMTRLRQTIAKRLKQAQENACVVGLKLFPAINAEIEDQDIIYKNYYNISFAVGTEKGLVVPVLRNADEMSFADIEKEIKKLSEKANKGNLTIEDLQGGTFTISNGGVYGSMLSTPILNPPQSAILGMHKIQDRPMVIEGKVEIRPMMYLALTYDHRLLDGKDAVSFLVKIKELLESPESMILGV